jgi:hypothetical protein
LTNRHVKGSHTEVGSMPLLVNGLFIRRTFRVAKRPSQIESTGQGEEANGKIIE